NDQVKFVICDREDYQWSKEKLTEYKLNDQCEVLFSGSYGEIQTSQLADWILEDQLPVRLQIQLHKYLWGDVPGK
ncbi:MAG: 7-carboxy-7-deazaguanine synthase QueE, partial [Calditrichia bacterium]